MEKAIAVGHVEDEGDLIYHNALSRLFRDEMPGRHTVAWLRIFDRSGDFYGLLWRRGGSLFAPLLWRTLKFVSANEAHIQTKNAFRREAVFIILLGLNCLYKESGGAMSGFKLFATYSMFLQIAFVFLALALTWFGPWTHPGSK